MKKRILFAAMGLALSAGCFAQSASDVIIKTTSGDKTYKISEVKNLRIEGNWKSHTNLTHPGKVF